MNRGIVVLVCVLASVAAYTALAGGTNAVKQTTNSTAEEGQWVGGTAH